jgi:hypothetical protein
MDNVPKPIVLSTQEGIIMGFITRKWLAFFQKKRNFFLISATWLAGIICGCFLAAFTGSTYRSMLESASLHPVTLTGLFAGIVFPTVLIILAANVRLYWLLYLTVLCKVTFVIACSLGLQGVYGSAGWLVRLFVQFSDILTLPVFCWLSLRSTKKAISKAVCATVAAWYFLVFLADYCVISPFFAGLIVK